MTSITLKYYVVEDRLYKVLLVFVLSSVKLNWARKDLSDLNPENFMGVAKSHPEATFYHFTYTYFTIIYVSYYGNITTKYDAPPM